MLLSMTGFGASHCQENGLAVSVEVRTINSRYFKLSVRSSEGYAALEPHIEEVVRRAIHRGTIQVALRAERLVAAEDYRLNTDVLERFRNQLEELKRRWDLKENISLSRPVAAGGRGPPGIDDSPRRGGRVARDRPDAGGRTGTPGPDAGRRGPGHGRRPDRQLQGRGRKSGTSRKPLAPGGRGLSRPVARKTAKNPGKIFRAARSFRPHQGSQFFCRPHRHLRRNRALAHPTSSSSSRPWNCPKAPGGSWNS